MADKVHVAHAIDVESVEGAILFVLRAAVTSESFERR